MQALSARPELTFFEANFSRMVANHRGQFVLIKGQKVVEFYESYGDALAAGYDHFGLQPFFVKQVTEESNTVHFVRDLGPWRS